MRLHRDQRGGAVVELAICSVAIVPLVMYGMWFSDVAHVKLKLQEAQVSAVMDLTAWRVRPTSVLDDGPGQFAAEYDRAAQLEARAVENRMGRSFDSVYSSPDTLFLKPGRMSVDCVTYPGDRSPGDTVDYDMNLSRPGERVKDLNIKTWVTCKTSATLHTAGIPRRYEQRPGESLLWNHGDFELCGVGRGVQGCGRSDLGLPIMLDDWALENPWDVPLSLIPHDENDVPRATEGDNTEGVHDSSMQPGTFNRPYVKLTMRYFRKPDGNTKVVKNVMEYVAGAREMGLTDDYHVSYRYGGKDDHNYYIAHETRLGQHGAFGGPDGSSEDTSNPHTGGPWHEREASWADTQVNSWGWSHAAFDARHSGKTYLGVKSWATDE